MFRDLGIYNVDAYDTKRGFSIFNPSIGAVQVRLDCVKLEPNDQMLQSYYDAKARTLCREFRLPKLTLNHFPK